MLGSEVGEENPAHDDTVLVAFLVMLCVIAGSVIALFALDNRSHH